MDDNDAKHVLLTIRRVVAEIYPIAEGDVIDPRYAMALGLVAGVATEAIQAVSQSRPMRLGINIDPEGKRWK